MTIYEISVVFPGGYQHSLLTSDRSLADLTFEALNTTLPLGHNITMWAFCPTECLAVRCKWDDRKGHYAEATHEPGETR